MLKKLIKDLILRAGWVVHRFDPHAYPSYQILQSLEHVGVNLVFDVGANIGQFAKDLRWIGFQGKIISFEPLSVAHEGLLKSSGRDPLWRVHPRVAIGDIEGETDIHIAGNSVSSSVLPMLDAHRDAETESAYIGSERVQITRLDSIAPAYIEPDDRYFLKIDAQGFEWEVLDGGVATMKNAQGVFVEMSLVPLYEGQRPWSEIIDRLETTGFSLWALQKGFTDKQNGRSLQINAIFLRDES